MTSVALQSPPALGRAFRTELRSVWSAVMATIVGVAGVLLFFVSWMAIEIARWSGPPVSRPNFVYSAESAWLPAVVGLLLPFVVWRAEEPRRRFYLWAMPANRGSHTLTKITAGWLWLMALTAFYVVVMFLLSATVAHFGGAPMWARQPQWWEWLVPFTAGSVTYLLISAAVVGSNLPIAVIGLVIGLYTVPYIYAQGLHKERLIKVLQAVMSGRYGLVAGGFGNVVDYGQIMHDGRMAGYGAVGASADRWLGSAAIWIGVGLLLTVIVAVKHRDS